jgi:ribose 5-phosphate isomerase B
MIANRLPSVRATVYYGGGKEIVRLSRTHNDANVLSIGARFVSVDVAKREIWDWLHIPFSGEEKYTRRNAKIDSLTQNHR